MSSRKPKGVKEALTPLARALGSKKSSKSSTEPGELGLVLLLCLSPTNHRKMTMFDGNQLSLKKTTYALKAFFK